MKTKLKSTVIIGSTLIIGIILGFLLKSLVIESEFDRLKKLRDPQGFANALEEVIQPSDEQKEKLMPILEGFQSEMERMRNKARKEMTQVMDSLRIELEQILTDEQFIKLQEYLEKDQKPLRGDGPPFRKKPGD